MLNCITAIIPLLDILPRCRPPTTPPTLQLRMRPRPPNEAAWRDRRGNKRLALVGRETPTSTTTTTPFSLSPERDRPRAGRRSPPFSWWRD